MNHKLAVIGNPSSILLYKALGVETYGVENVEQTREILEDLASKDFGDDQKTAEYAVIFIEENLYQLLPQDLMERLMKKPLPSVIPVPSPEKGEEDYSIKRLSKIVEKAVGSDILS